MAEFYKEVYSFDKNKKTKTIVAIKEYNGWKYIDIREMIVSDNGSLMPTKKGVTIPLLKVGEMITAFETAEFIINKEKINNDSAPKKGENP